MYKKKNQFLSKIRGIIYIQSSSNNTILTVTDQKGDTFFWSSAGSVGFSGSRRKTSFAAQAAAESIAKKCREMGISQVEVRFRGFGQGRESSLRGLCLGGLSIKKILDQTSLPHNGCRPPKRPRG